MKRLPGIHGLRAVAAVGVMLMHTAAIAELSLPPGLDRIIPNLGLGVVLFFIVSAYSLLYSHEQATRIVGWVWPYLIKRLFRIAPLFWFIVCLYLLHPFYGPYPTAGAIVSNFIFVYNFFPGAHADYAPDNWSRSIAPAGWTIGVEMPFYLLLPLVIDRVRTVRGAGFLFGMSAVVALLGRQWLTKQYGQTSDYIGIAFVPNLADFAAGIAVYHLVRTWHEPKIVWRLAGFLALGALATLPLRIQLIPLIPSRPDILLWVVVLSAICAWQAAAPSNLLSTRPAQWLGERSFSIYLLHPFVIFLLSTNSVYTAIYDHLRLIGAWAYVACAGLTATLVFSASAITYRLIESPGQRVGGALIRQLDARRKSIPRNERSSPLTERL